MANPEKQSIALFTNNEGKSVKITIKPRMFEFAGLKHIARAQIFTKGRSIIIERAILENGNQSLKTVDLPSSYLAEVRYYPRDKRRTAINSITLLMFDADAVTISDNSGATSS